MIQVACEESQAVCKELRKQGAEAYSCDILPCSGGHPEWHIRGDTLPLINGDCSFTTQDGTEHKVSGEWDAIFAFPPCTHLAVSGARHFEKKRADGRQQQGINFFMAFVRAKCKRVVIENPVGVMSTEYRKPDQIIHPWMFGDKVHKQTCLWIRGLPLLVPDVTEKPEMEYFEWVDKNGRLKRQTRWYYETRCLPHKDRGRAASATFPGIAKAMAEQYSAVIKQEEKKDA